MVLEKRETIWETGDFEDLCRAASMEGPLDSELTCHFTIPHPYFLLQPVMEEVMQIDPFIVLWHEFVTPLEVEGIIETARPQVNLRLLLYNFF